MYTFLYLRGDTTFARGRYIAFIEDANKKCRDGIIHDWKRKIQRQAALVLIEVADTGHFEWKLFISRKACCQEETLEDLCQQYSVFLRTQNIENITNSLYDYTFRIMMEGLGVKNVSDLGSLDPQQIQSMLAFLSERLGINSRGTVFPIVRQVLSYLYSAGLAETNFSGMILSPAYQRVHLRPYMTDSDEEKLFRVMEDSLLRNKAMMRVALWLGLRDADICSLRFSQIDWKNDRIILKQEKIGVTLCLPLLEDVGNAIMDYIMYKQRIGN